MAHNFSSQQDRHFLLGLLGQSLGHSLSPLIHQSFFEELGLAGTYKTIEVAEPEQVKDRLLELAEEGYSGINVTIPYKLTVLPELSALDASAELAGAVNTIKFAPQFTGFNTDTSGLAEALSQLELFGNTTGSDQPRALILGCGGAARAAVIALSSLGFKQLEIICRDTDKAREMLDQILQSAQRASLVNNCRGAVLYSFADFESSGIGKNIALTINATPIGQKEKTLPSYAVQLLSRVVKNSVHPIFVDLVYGKELTPLCALARECGFAQVEDGKEMLIHQARLAFKIWTGHLPVGNLARERLNDKAQ